MRKPARPARHDTSGSVRPWSFPVAVTDIPETGRQFEVIADAPTRAAIAALAGLGALPRLQASFDVARQGSEGLRVAGIVTATVVQTCVVTLEPLNNEVDEQVDLVFLPAARSAAGAGERNEVEAEEMAELLTDGMVDLGAIATEFLILGIDPYPRKQGAVFQPPAGEDAAARPFAALAALKKEHGGHGR